MLFTEADSLRFRGGTVMKKSGMMKAVLAVAVFCCVTAWGAVGVTNVTVQQRYPWNGLVDIDYEVMGAEDSVVHIAVMGRDEKTDEIVWMKSLSGDGADGTVAPGKHRITWNLGADYPRWRTDGFSVKILAWDTPLFMVVDLSGGLEADSFPVSYLDAIPAGGWTDDYKTGKLVLRFVAPGTYTMGSPIGELGRTTNEIQHDVTLTEGFYIGVFECTQRQWELVMGSHPSEIEGEMRPVSKVNVDNIRGMDKGSHWPFDNKVDATSFMGILRAKTGLGFDLPTEAQWEYACRAGTETELNSGKNLTSPNSCVNMAEVGRYWFNRNDGKGGYATYCTTVGSYLPNAWGLYDMHGNRWEWCLDWFQDSLGSFSVINPFGALSGTHRVFRGGSCGDYAQHCRSARRGYNDPAGVYDNAYGFRVACLGTEKTPQMMEWNEIGSATILDKLLLEANASSGLPVSFKVVSGPGILIGNELHFTGLGKVVVRATQWGDESWAPISCVQCISVQKVPVEFEIADKVQYWMAQRKASQ